MNPIAVSVVVPSYNERGNIRPLTEQLSAALAGISHEIIVVDDDSPDRTWEEVERVAQDFPALHCFRRIGKRGLASAVVDGFAIARGESLVCIDADLQHDPSKVPLLVAALAGAPVAVATRYAGDGGVGEWNGVRLAMSRFATNAARWLLHVRTSDPMSGFFAVRRSEFQRVAGEMQPRGYKILLEILHRVRPDHVAEVAFTFADRLHGESKLTAAVIFDYLAALWDLRFGAILPVRFLKYCLVGLSGVGVQLLATHFLRRIPELKTEDSGVATALAILTAMISNYVFDNLWTFREVRHRNALAWLTGFARFAAVCGTGAVISWSVTFGVRHATDMRMNIYFGQLVGIAVATVWNYMLNRHFTWASRE